jgi:chemotaxis protein methyltransferase CheR
MPERARRLPDALLDRLRELLAEEMGLHFPPERYRSLESAMRLAARELGHPDVESCIHSIVASPLGRGEVEILASHLTVGETYFFRDKEALVALETELLPGLLRSRAQGERRLRIWSAGCCTGEEAYSIAIVLARAMPDLRHWNVSILASDINPRFLRKASAGVYGEWSFRNVPAAIRNTFFARTPEGRLQLVERIRSMVTFTYLNLAEDVYPAVENGTNAMDFIFCRNVLMYFEPGRSRAALEKLGRCLVPDGWLFVNPVEISRLAVPQLEAVKIAGAFAYRKKDASARPMPSFPAAPFWPPIDEAGAPSPANLGEAAKPADHEPTPYERAAISYALGRYAEVVERLESALARHPDDAEAMALLARAYANQGRLAEALAWCAKAVAADKLDARWHFLLATVLQEQGMAEQCEAALNRALYLDENCALAHFALGNLSRGQGRREESLRHFRNALSVLAAYRDDEVLPESEGLSAGRLAEIIGSAVSSELAS